MYSPSLITPRPPRVTYLISWFVPQFPQLPRQKPSVKKLPPPPPRIVLPPRTEPVRWDRPVPDPMAFVLMDDWERDAEKPRLS